MALDYSKINGTAVTTATNKGEARWEDADTVYSNGQGYRIAGLQADEVQHITDSGIIPGEWGGKMQTQAVSSLASELGFDQLVETGRETYGRKEAHLKDKDGNDFTNSLYANGIIKPGKWASDQQIDLAEQGWFNRSMDKFLSEKNGVPLEEDAWSRARDDIREATQKTVVRDEEGNMTFKSAALNEDELSLYNDLLGPDYSPFLQSEVKYRHSNRDIEGNARNVFAAGWDQGWNSIRESGFGGLQILGDLFESDWLTRKGELGADRIAAETRGLPKFVQSWGDMEFGENFGDYMKGMAGVALPYMLGIAGSAAVAPVIAGAGLTGAAVGIAAPVWVYAGEVYNNMEGTRDEKNAGTAIAGGMAMAILDRFALKGIMQPAQLMKKEGWRQLEEQLIKKKIAEQVARRGGGELPEFLRSVAVRQAKEEMAEAQGVFGAQLVKGLLGEADLVLNYGLLAKEGVLGTLKGAAIESLTEVGQEGTGYLASVYGSEKALDYTELADIAINAAAGGALLGGGISGAFTTAGGYGDFRSLQKKHALAKEEANKNFWNETTDEAAVKLTEQAREGEALTEIPEEIKEGERLSKTKEKGFWKTLRDLPGEAFRKKGSIMESEFMNNNAIPEAGKKALGTLLDLYSRSNVSHFAGKGIQAAKRDLVEKYTYDAKRIKRLTTATFGMKHSRKNDKIAVNELKRYVDTKKAGGDVSEFAAIEPQLIQLHAEITKLTNGLRETVHKQTGEPLGYLEDWFFESSRLSPTKVRKNKGAFIKTMQQDYNYTADEAEAFYENQVLEGNFNPAANENFRGEADKGATGERTAKFNENPNMNQFLEDDHFAKLDQNINDMIDYAITTKFLGKQDEKLFQQIAATKKAMGEHWDPRIAKYIMDSVNTSRGEYKAIKNKKLKEAQDFVSFINALTQLDTSVLASLPEIALVIVSARNDGGMVGLVAKGAKGLVDHYRAAFSETLGHVKASKIPSVGEINPSVADINLNSLSFYNTGYGGTSGVTAHVDVDSSAYKGKELRSKILENFFRINLLKPLTDGSRIARLAIANDAIFADFEAVHGFYNQNGGNSNYANDAFDRLRELNINPVQAADTYKQIVNEASKRAPGQDTFEYIYENYPEFYEQMETARHSYVDGALARPTSEDRPIWYSNPHFRLLTQYQGFLSTFTSHILPRLWKRARKADPTVKYQAFAVAATMLMLAALGQRLKDEWKYGEESPHIYDPVKKVQRVVNASGLTGTAGRVIDFVHPIYGNKPGYNQTAFDQAGNFAKHVTDEAGPFVGTVKGAAKVASNIINGDNQRSMLYGGEKFIPVIGRNKLLKDLTRR